MITRPLGLAARLRPLPPAHDALFYVNVLLTVFFFSLFSSRFVLAPGLTVPLTGARAAVQRPWLAGAVAGAQTTDVVITVRSAQSIMVDTGVLRMEDLPGWLRKQAKGRKNLRLLVEADLSLPSGDQVRIAEMATEAGFAELQWATQSVGPRNETAP